MILMEDNENSTITSLVDLKELGEVEYSWTNFKVYFYVSNQLYMNDTYDIDKFPKRVSDGLFKYIRITA